MVITKLHLKQIQVVLTVLFIILFTILPSVSTDTIWEGTFSAKTVFFLALIALVVPLATITLASASRVGLDLVDILIIIYFIYICFNRYLLQPFYSFSLRYIELVDLIVLFFILKYLIAKRFLHYLYLSMLVGAAAQLSVGLLQLYSIIPSENSMFKVTGHFFNSGPLAGFLASIIPLAVCAFHKTPSAFVMRLSISKEKQIKLIKYLCAYVILGSIIILPVLKSRASLVAIAISLTMIYYKVIGSYINQFIVKTQVRKLLTAIGILLLLVITYLLFAIKLNSSLGRFYILANSIEMFKSKPFLGFGFDRFKSEYMNYQAASFKAHPNPEAALLADNVYYAFNTPVQFLVENGIFGLLIASSIIFVTIINYRKGSITSTALYGLISIIAFSCFSYPSEILPIKLNTVMYMSVITFNPCGRYKFRLPFNFSPATVMRKSLLIAMLGVSLLISIFTGTYAFKLYNSYKDWKTGYIAYVNNNYETSIRHYQRTFNFLLRNGELLTNYAKTLYFDKQYHKALQVFHLAELHINNTVLETGMGDTEFALGRYGQAEFHYQKALQMIPSRLYTKYLLLNLYRNTGDDVKTIRIARDILNSPIKVNSPATDSIRSEALKIFKQN